MEALLLNKKIYSQIALEKAIVEYQGVAKITYQSLPEYFEINFKEVDSELGDIIKDEFANYVLGLLS